MRWAGNVALVEQKYLFRIVRGIPDGKRPFNKFMHKCKGRIKIGLKESACEGVD
jgi:hypothetical protein